ncbi:MAG: di-trans,poly-cis-decaprenylcistransferase [Clostridia bacterium]|nr:di-trans,poly-cis-decaprenylcistransferase [Clostridia bacterium]
MDGNGRFATAKGLARSEGHKAGAETLRRIAIDAADIGIKYLTVYAFSTENWKRPKDEVSGIMKLLYKYLKDWDKYIGGRHVRIRVIGDISDFDPVLKKMIEFVENSTKKETELTLNIALGYGGRNEIISAAKKMAEDYKSDKLKLDEVNEDVFSKYLYTSDIPDPDLIIRPGGEVRISNFLVWQSAYSEFYFTDTLWPDFTKENLLEAVAYYQSKHRRFGGL